jgi:hypothetical protein
VEAGQVIGADRLDPLRELSPTISPRTSRPTSSVMPVAMTTAWEAI